MTSREESSAITSPDQRGTYSDGSEVTGKAVAKVDSPDPNAIPWLLVTSTGHSGNGVLSRVTRIQRIHTRGGLAPPAADCDAAKQNVEVRSATPPTTTSTRPRNSRAQSARVTSVRRDLFSQPGTFRVSPAEAGSEF
jgi:hypothetical protein